MARSYEELNEIDKAIAIYEKILRLDINYSDVADNLGRLKEQAGIAYTPSEPKPKRRKKELVCPRCKAKNPAEKRFCGECGSRLAK